MSFLYAPCIKPKSRIALTKKEYYCKKSFTQTINPNLRYHYCTKLKWWRTNFWVSTQAVLQQELQNEARKAKRNREAAFKAAPAPAHPTPRPPRPSRQPLTAAQTPDLALRSRSVARAAFDAAGAEKERRAEVHSHSAADRRD